MSAERGSSSLRPRWFPQVWWRRAFFAGREYERSVWREPWEVRHYRKADDLLRKVWNLHSTPVTHDRPGFGGVGRTFWCSHCRMPWPCDTARLVINWGEIEERDYEPLRLIERPKGPDAERPTDRGPDEPPFEVAS
jgi:hypothetical protein